MMLHLSNIVKGLPPLAPGVGGALITSLQIMATVTSYSAETNPQTVAQYSKFAHQNVEHGDDGTMIPSKFGMTVIYLPALLVSLVLYFGPSIIGSTVPAAAEFFPNRTLAGNFVIVHFIKRLLEVFFLHEYSGKVKLNLCVGIGTYYALVSTLICYLAFPVTNITVGNIGTAMFGIGLAGNFYHHYLLVKLRKDSKKTDGAKYVAPKGGLFNYVAAPHYFFELIGWLGIAIVAQQMNAYLVFMSMTSYLAGRAVSQNAWNRSKFSREEWPASRGNMIPFLF